MNKVEALHFLGLEEPVTNEMVQKRCDEQYGYYRMLFSNAPNPVVKSLQQQNLDKLEAAKKVLVVPIEEKKPSPVNKIFTTALNKFNLFTGKVQVPEPVAWLIVHTEQRQAESFRLYEGVNYIGRKKSTEGNSIVLEEDLFISRIHAFIKCRNRGGSWEFDLYDGDGNKASANGIYLNGNERKIKHRCSLENNDTIQIGRTKLVFRIADDQQSESAAIAHVRRGGFMPTVDFQ